MIGLEKKRHQIGKDEDRYEKLLSNDFINDNERSLLIAGSTKKSKDDKRQWIV